MATQSLVHLSTLNPRTDGKVFWRNAVRKISPLRSASVNDHFDNRFADSGAAADTIPEVQSGSHYEWAVEQHYSALYRFAFGLTASESDAADLTQETYHVFLAKGDAIRDAHKVKSWLFTTLYRLFLGRRRHSARFPETSVELAVSELPPIVPRQAEALEGSLVVSALHQLEEIHRAPLMLFYLQELSYKEIAEVLGLPMGTIMSRISRGKEILRARLQGSAPSTAHSNSNCSTRQSRASVTS